MHCTKPEIDIWFNRSTAPNSDVHLRGSHTPIKIQFPMILLRSQLFPCSFRWSKFILKPPYSMMHGNFSLAIWDFDSRAIWVFFQKKFRKSKFSQWKSDKSTVFFQKKFRKSKFSQWKSDKSTVFFQKNSENQSFLNERVTSLPYFYLVSGRGRYIGYVMGQFWTEYNVLKGGTEGQQIKKVTFWHIYSQWVKVAVLTSLNKINDCANCPQ